MAVWRGEVLIMMEFLFDDITVITAHDKLSKLEKELV